jgi:predicted DsbA family dithiol-disulfide isomerase
MRLVTLSIAVFVLACSQPQAKPQAAASGDQTPALRIGDETITVSELDAWIKDQLFQQETHNGEAAKLYEVRAQGAENLIAQRLLDAEAKRLGQDPDSLLEAEARKRTQVPEEEVQRFYDEHKANFGDRPVDEVKQQIRDHLERRRAPEAAREYVDSLRQSAHVAVLLERPRTQVEAVGPSRGPADAPVTIVEFSDYQCPFCKRAEDTVGRVLAEYGDKVRFVYRDFPLQNHTRAVPASVAARCAAEQGKFWEFHQNLMTIGGSLADDDLKKRATDLQLDGTAFAACFDTNRHQPAVQQSLMDGSNLGVTGTPTFFINGRMLVGAKPFEEFKAVIDHELELAEQKTGIGG